MSIKVYSATSPAKLLLVDDHPMIRRGLADLLGFENNISVVAEANHGEEALAYLANHSVDLIVLDNNMPVMNGLETTKRIRSLDRPDSVLPIIALSANAFEEDMDASRAAGMDAHLSKPIEPEKLYNCLAQCITEK